MNIEHVLRPGVVYIHNIQHRNGNQNKSQWIIVDTSERACFLLGYSVWHNDEHTSWGLHIVDGAACNLGCTAANAAQQYMLFLAKFVDSSQNGRWHGYPADPGTKTQDIPATHVLNDWVMKNYVRRALARKITQGQRCIL